MTCQICHTPCTKPVKGEPVHVYIKDVYETVGHWAKPLEDADLCWYHRKVADGHFSRGDEYYRKPDVWTLLGQL